MSQNSSFAFFMAFSPYRMIGDFSRFVIVSKSLHQRFWSGDRDYREHMRHEDDNLSITELFGYERPFLIFLNHHFSSLAKTGILENLLQHFHQ